MQGHGQSGSFQGLYLHLPLGNFVGDFRAGYQEAQLKHPTRLRITQKQEREEMLERFTGGVNLRQHRAKASSPPLHVHTRISPPWTTAADILPISSVANIFSHRRARHGLLLEGNSSSLLQPDATQPGSPGPTWRDRKQGHPRAFFPNERRAGPERSAHHVLLRFVLAVDHLLLGADQLSVLLAQCGACGESAAACSAPRRASPPGRAPLSPRWEEAPCLQG